MASVIVDAALVARTEASYARCNAAIARLIGDTEVFGGGHMIVLGPGRYINRTLGAGLSQPSAAELDRMERFYIDRNVAPALEVTSWTPRSTIELLGERGYRGVWFRNVFVRSPDIAGLPAVPADVTIAPVDEGLVATWLDTLAIGNELTEPDARAVSDQFAAARFAVDGCDSFMSFVDGRPAGCGSLERCDGIGWVGGAATQPWCRGRGAQTSLLVHRIALARDLGCDLVAATALPDGTSARNLLRLGFEIVYTQLVMAKPAIPSDDG